MLFVFFCNLNVVLLVFTHPPLFLFCCVLLFGYVVGVVLRESVFVYEGAS